MFNAFNGLLKSIKVSSNLTAPTISFLRQLWRQCEVQAAEVHFKLPVGPDDDLHDKAVRN